MKFLIDMPLSPSLAQWLNAQGHDAIHAASAGMNRSTDIDLIERARDDDRIVVTADLDYPRLLSFMRADRPAVILFRGGNYSEQQMLHLLQLTLSRVPSHELEHSLVVVDQMRIRKRRLPI